METEPKILFEKKFSFWTEQCPYPKPYANVWVKVLLHKGKVKLMIQRFHTMGAAVNPDVMKFDSFPTSIPGFKKEVRVIEIKNEKKNKYLKVRVYLKDPTVNAFVDNVVVFENELVNPFMYRVIQRLLQRR